MLIPRWITNMFFSITAHRDVTQMKFRQLNGKIKDMDIALTRFSTLLGRGNHSEVDLGSVKSWTLPCCTKSIHWSSAETPSVWALFLWQIPRWLPCINPAIISPFSMVSPQSFAGEATAVSRHTLLCTTSISRSAETWGISTTTQTSAKSRQIN